MSLTFANFKKLIPSQILTRGREYWRAHQILDLAFDEEETLWQAQVEGTEQYEVEVQLTPKKTLECSCTCPYDMGEHCKHIAAVLYAIEESFPDQLGMDAPKKTAKKPTRQDTLRQLLEKTPPAKIIAALLDLAKSNRELHNQLAMLLNSDTTSSQDYRRVIKDILRTIRKEHGYIDYPSAERAAKKVNNLLVQAHQWREEGDFARAIRMYQAIIDELPQIIYYHGGNDSTLGDCQDLAIQALDQCADIPDPTYSQILLDYCLIQTKNHKWYDSDPMWDLLRVAEKSVRTPAQRAQFMADMQAREAFISKGDPEWDYKEEMGGIASLKLGVIKRFDSPDVAYQFMLDHAQFDPVRMELIEHYIQQNALDKAVEYIQQGIAANSQYNNHPFTSITLYQYQDMLLEVLQLQGNTKGMIEVARTRWLIGYEEKYFAILKQIVPPAEWDPFVDKLSKAVRNDNVLAALYASEERWQQLFDMAKRYHGSGLLMTYREPLEQHFPTEICAIYLQIVEKMILSMANRTDYQVMTVYLQRLQALGQREQAQAIANRLRAQYPRRSALLEELSKL
jgi:hypothetical protein